MGRNPRSAVSVFKDMQEEKPESSDSLKGSGGWLVKRLREMMSNERVDGAVT